MKILNFIFNRQKKRGRSDYYQKSIERQGRDQIKKLVEKGLSIPVIVL